MNKQTIAGAVVLVVVVLGIALYAAVRPKPALAPTATLPAPTMTLPELTYTEHTTRYDIDAHYASSTRMLKEPANAAAIEQMKDFIANAIEQFKTDVSAAGTDTGAKATLKIVYLIFLSPRAESYVFTIDSYLPGAAHGNRLFKTFVFSTDSGQSSTALPLADLFVPGAHYLDLLSQLAHARLPEVIGSDYDVDMIRNGTTPTDEHFQNFFLDNRDLVILFPPYQVAAYADGPQTLRLPVSLLANILEPRYRQ
ncbi:DUF3298 domain-containing protein [Patescibacteria group bacterium]|nr:DUF3298 domain-containing protein [Patescibacteria group bacterium]